MLWYNSSASILHTCVVRPTSAGSAAPTLDLLPLQAYLIQGSVPSDCVCCVAAVVLQHECQRLEGGRRRRPRPGGRSAASYGPLHPAACRLARAASAHTFVWEPFPQLDLVLMLLLVSCGIFESGWLARSTSAAAVCVGSMRMLQAGRTIQPAAHSGSRLRPQRPTCRRMRRAQCRGCLPPSSSRQSRSSRPAPTQQRSSRSWTRCGNVGKSTAAALQMHRKAFQSNGQSHSTGQLNLRRNEPVLQQARGGV